MTARSSRAGDGAAQLSEPLSAQDLAQVLEISLDRATTMHARIAAAAERYGVSVPRHGDFSAAVVLAACAVLEADAARTLADTARARVQQMGTGVQMFAAVVLEAVDKYLSGEISDTPLQVNGIQTTPAKGG